MNQKTNYESVVQLEIKLQELSDKMDMILDCLKPKSIEQTDGYQQHEIVVIEPYTSNSGNRTYKAYTSDETLIYIRQAHQELFMSAGLWHTLQGLERDQKFHARITLYTIPDGDFKKPVKVDIGGYIDTTPIHPEHPDGDVPFD